MPDRGKYTRQADHAYGSPAGVRQLRPAKAQFIAPEKHGRRSRPAEPLSGSTGRALLAQAWIEIILWLECMQGAILRVPGLVWL